MKKLIKQRSSRRTTPRRGTAIDWSKAIRNPYAAALRNKRWRVEFDPDLTELLWGSGDFMQRLRRVAKGPRRRLVTVVPMTEADYKAFKPFLERLGAKATYQPEHPSWSATERRKRRVG